MGARSNKSPRQGSGLRRPPKPNGHDGHNGHGIPDGASVASSRVAARGAQGVAIDLTSPSGARVEPLGGANGHALAAPVPNGDTRDAAVEPRRKKARKAGRAEGKKARKAAKAESGKAEAKKARKAAKAERKKTRKAEGKRARKAAKADRKKARTGAKAERKAAKAEAAARPAAAGREPQGAAAQVRSPATAAERLAAFDPDELQRDLRLACISRAIDDREISLQKQSRVFFQISGAGHEALYLGFAHELRPGYDWFFPYYRDLALVLGLGVSPSDVLRQAVGSADEDRKSVV